MIGNDIVDFALAKKESNWQRKNWLTKLFSSQEIKWILNAKNSDSKIWEFWTKKEATYKIVNRENNERIFNPLAYKICRVKRNYVVSFNHKIYYTHTEITKEYCYTIALQNETDFINVVELPNDIVLKKNNDVPFLIDNPKILLSKTNHGRFQKIIGLEL